MAYSVTGIRTAPDIGYKTESRRTASGARECAIAFISDGMREVEVRDGSGNLKSLQQLDDAGDDVWNFSVTERLASL